MALYIKTILADAFLELCNEKALKKITISNLQAKTGISRQTFYNHFKDRYDLIQYIYESKIITDWLLPSPLSTDFCDALFSCLKSDIKYHKFLKQALMMTEQNNLRDFMYEHSKKFNRAWHQAYYGEETLPEELIFASDYHSCAQMYMRIEWILKDFPIPPETMAEHIINMRISSLNEMLFSHCPDNSPYVKALKKCRVQRPL